MHLTSYITSLAGIMSLSVSGTIAAGSKVGPYTVVYWDNAVADCQGKNTSSIAISQLNTCYKLQTSARSFNTGNKKHPSQIPSQYILQGFPSCKQCAAGNENAVDFNVGEGSAADTCYIVPLEDQKPVNCLWLTTA